MYSVAVRTVFKKSAFFRPDTANAIHNRKTAFSKRSTLESVFFSINVWKDALSGKEKYIQMKKMCGETSCSI